MLNYVIRSIVEEVVKNNILKFKSLALVHSETKSMLKNRWYLFLRLLIPHYNHLIAAKICFLDCIRSLCVLIFAQKYIEQGVKEA